MSASASPVPFDDALDAAIDALQRGRPLEAVVSDHGRTGLMLRPLLETADAARQSATLAPLSRALEHNYAIVRAAVERAQMAAAAQPKEAAPPAPSFWKRRLGFASLSLPAGALVLALTVGAAGAASLVATNNGGVLGDIVSPVVPDVIIPAALVQDDDDARGTAPAANNDGSDVGPNVTPGGENGPQATTVDGTISDVNGNTFTLTVGADTYHVQIDSNTEVAGEILDGGTAEVTGDLTAEKNLHAKNVDAQGGTPDENGKPDDPGQPGDPAGQDKDRTDPPGQDDEPNEPPGQSDDPPGTRGGGNDNENSNNGNGGGSEKP